MRQELEVLLSGLVKDLFDYEGDVVVSRTAEEHGDFASNIALQLSGKIGKNPREIAEAVSLRLNEHEMIESAQVAGPGFINITLPKTAYFQKLYRLTNEQKERFGRSQLGSGLTVVCEFPSPNMAKPFSVGHMRPALQGWAIYQLMLRMGYNVITDNHLGDSGTPFGKWVVGFLRNSSEEKLALDGIAELARVYIQISSDLKAEKEAGGHEMADEVQKWLKKLESSDSEALGYSNRFNQISLDHMHQVMNRLGISTEYELGESVFVERGQQLVDELLDKGVATNSEGAVIVSLEDERIDTPLMLRKANGAALYATTDLATVEYRQNTWNPVKTFVHTGQEQAFYFRQLNAVVKKAGYSAQVTHLWHGLIDQKNEDGTREKMSSRKGVVLMNDLIDYAEQKAKEFVSDIASEDTHAVALAAIKFNDFASDRKNGVLFDWETMFSVHGFSGPAVQYAAVRIRSILAKSEVANPKPHPDYDWASEKPLLLSVLEYPELLRELHDSYEMHKLAAYLYDLAKELNRYYEAVQVLQSELRERDSRLWLLSVVKYVLQDGLEILGIPTPEKM